MDVEGSASFAFGQKLKILKVKITQWKREEFRRLDVRMKSCLQKVSEIEQKGHSSSLPMHNKVDTLYEYNRLLRLEEISWR